MTRHTAELAARLVGTLDDPSSPVPLMAGPSGAGRTSVLLQVRDRLGPARCQYVSVERVATTPERFLRALVEDSPFRGGAHTQPANVKGPREAYDASLAFLTSACTDAGQPATFLLDEVLDLRTFESFPGLRTAMPDLVSAMAASPNRFALATRFTARAAKLADGARGRLALQLVPTLRPSDVREALTSSPLVRLSGDVLDDLARTVHALADGRPGYVRALLEAMAALGGPAGADPVGALVALLTHDAPLAAHCRFSYELRLHRARGYGALKGILAVLADEEPLTLTAISQRLARTPGSAKDYLGWLEDVDLIVAERKRYRFADPLLRLWVRLQAHSLPPSEEVLVREVQRYAMLRLAQASRTEALVEAEPAALAAAAPASTAPSRSRSSDIVEFD